jgi:hypothetical protein
VLAAAGKIDKNLRESFEIIDMVSLLLNCKQLSLITRKRIPVSVAPRWSNKQMTMSVIMRNAEPIMGCLCGTVLETARDGRSITSFVTPHLGDTQARLFDGSAAVYTVCAAPLVDAVHADGGQHDFDGRRSACAPPSVG